MATKDIGAEGVDTSRFLDSGEQLEFSEPTFLEGKVPDSQLPIFMTRHTLDELLGKSSVDAPSGENKGNL